MAGQRLEDLSYSSTALCTHTLPPPTSSLEAASEPLTASLNTSLLKIIAKCPLLLESC